MKDSKYLKKLQLRIQEDEESIDYIISKTPEVLDSDDKDVIKAGIYYLPYSTGFEMEFDNNGELTQEMFSDLDLLDLDINDSEQRFRIDVGIKGLKQLSAISKILRHNAVFSDYSGIHYHVDCTDSYSSFKGEHIKDNWDWIKNELEHWDYKGTYNKEGYCGLGGSGGWGSWLKFQSGFKTMEYRIGSMTFDYRVLFKRISHANYITKTFKMLVKQNTKNSAILEYSSKEKKIKKILNDRIIKI